MPAEVVGERLADAEDRDAAGRRTRDPPDFGEERGGRRAVPRRLPGALGDEGQAGQRQIGVGRLRDGPEQRVLGCDAELAISRCALATSAKPIRASQPVSEVRAPLTL